MGAAPIAISVETSLTRPFPGRAVIQGLDSRVVVELLRAAAVLEHDNGHIVFVDLRIYRAFFHTKV